MSIIQGSDNINYLAEALGSKYIYVTLSGLKLYSHARMEYFHRFYTPSLQDSMKCYRSEVSKGRYVITWDMSHMIKDKVDLA